MVDTVNSWANVGEMTDVALEVDTFPIQRKNRDFQKLIINGVFAPILIGSFGLLVLGIIWQEKESVVTKGIISGFSVLGIGSSTITLLWNNYPRKRPL